MRILLVEDDARIARAVLSALAGAGYAWTTSATVKRPGSGRHRGL